MQTWVRGNQANLGRLNKHVLLSSRAVRFAVIITADFRFDFLVTCRPRRFDTCTRLIYHIPKTDFPYETDTFLALQNGRFSAPLGGGCRATHAARRLKTRVSRHGDAHKSHA